MSVFGGDSIRHKVSSATPTLTDGDIVIPSIETVTAGTRVYLAGGSTGTLSTPLRNDPTGTTDQPVRLKDGTGNAITSTGGKLDVNVTLAAGGTSVLSGQIAVTGSAVAFSSNAIKSVTIKALVGNTISVYVGPTGVTTSTGYELIAGDSITLALANTNTIYLIASTTGASVSWIATN